MINFKKTDVSPHEFRPLGFISGVVYEKVVLLVMVMEKWGDEKMLRVEEEQINSDVHNEIM